MSGEFVINDSHIAGWILNGPDKFQLMLALFHEPRDRHPASLQKLREEPRGGRRRADFKARFNPERHAGWQNWYLRGGLQANWNPEGDDWILYVEMLASDLLAPSKLKIKYSTKTHKGEFYYIREFPG